MRINYRDVSDYSRANTVRPYNFTTYSPCRDDHWSSAIWKSSAIIGNPYNAELYNRDTKHNVYC